MIFNVKFVSKGDGRYEAVYDRKGKLVTENTRRGDNIGYRNMGTYNYASPSKDPFYHTVYDVSTFYEYGNISGTGKGFWKENEIAYKTLGQFLNNPDAVESYNSIAIKFDEDLLVKKNPHLEPYPYL